MKGLPGARLAFPYAREHGQDPSELSHVPTRRKVFGPADLLAEALQPSFIVVFKLRKNLAGPGLKGEGLPPALSPRGHGR